MEKQKCPVVRFSKFGENWEAQPLKNIFGKIRNAFVGTATPYYVKKGNFYLESNNVKDGLINRKTQIFIDDYFYFKQKDKWLKTGDLVMVQSGHVGHAAVIPEELNNSAAHALIMFSDYKVPTNPYFLNYQLQTNNAKSAIEKFTTGNTIRHILSSDMKEFLGFFTNFDEQLKVGEFFQNLDQSIALHEKKLIQTQNFKKAMLEKMFPKQGSLCPEIRLKGFSGDWEERQLKDISFKVLEKNSEHLYSETFTNSAQFGVISQRDFFDKDISNTSNIGGYYVVKDNDFIYNPRISNFAPVGPVKRNKLGRTGVVSPLYFVFRTHDADHQFLETYFETSVWHKFMLLNGDTGARSDRLAIKDTIFMEMPVYCPSFEEQQKIGQFFKQLDETIKLQQQQLQTVKNLKQAFLEKMFV
ncbi:restriction endonuclease subunit S [Acinetobacter johnsonii]|uniref:restriction endonuclease subunit S n=1 Tax=Acinetobacter sp. YH12144 TaxID=2601128 RepID=UPI001E2B39AD